MGFNDCRQGAGDRVILGDLPFVFTYRRFKMPTKTTEQAIQTDATEQMIEASQQTAAQDRENNLAAILDRRMESLVEDGVDMTGVERTAAPKVEEEIDQVAAQLESTEQRVRVKVDGEELELPLSEVVRSYQKDATATKRLQEATRLLEIAENQAKTVATTPKEENNQQQPETGEAREARLAKILGAASKLYEGDEASFAESMLEMFEESGAKATQNPQIDTATIAAEVRQQLAVESAYGTAKSDYPELFAETERGILLGKETHKRMLNRIATGIPKDQALYESAEEVAGLFGIERTGRQLPKRTARETKLGRKAGLDNLDSANAVAGDSSAAAEVEDVSSVIKQMAQARLGQTGAGLGN